MAKVNIVLAKIVWIKSTVNPQNNLEMVLRQSASRLLSTGKVQRHKVTLEIQLIRNVKNCGGDFPHRLKCPAIGVECHYCHKKNHFISVCRKRIKNSRRQHLREIVEDVSEESDLGINIQRKLNDDSDPEVSYGLKCDQVSHINSKVPCMTLKINDVETKSLIDTGSSLNIIDERVIQKMSPRTRLIKSKVKAYAFGQKKPLAMKGKYTCTVESDQKFTTAEFHVVADNNETIISYQTAVSLNIIPCIRSVTEKQYSDLCDKYAKVFQGLGKLKDREI